MLIKYLNADEHSTWDRFVQTSTDGTLYHLSGFGNVIERTYGHKTHYLMAVKENHHLSFGDNQPKNQASAAIDDLKGSSITGVLPLVHIKHFPFGNSLISMPFFDFGGALAADVETERALLSEAIQLGHRLKAKKIELRNLQAQLFFKGLYSMDPINSKDSLACVTKSHKVRMLLQLPESSEILMKSFKSKLRNQIKRPLKEGLYSKVGGIELLKDFYKVFSVNMRDLGSPVHSKKLMQAVLEEFPEKAKIVMVYKDEMPLACSLIVGFKGTLANPWASALREYSRLSPNMLLYWSMLEYASDNGYMLFDFGRSSPDEGTYKFKEQWGAKPTTLHWHYISLDGQMNDNKTTEKSKYGNAIRYWQKLPVPVTKIIGPRIRKYISL